jgi:hypothetical protein
MPNPWIRSYRVVFAVLALVAIAAQFTRSMATYGSATNFFSYFTIQGNLYAAAVLLWTAGPRPATPGRDSLRGAMVLYLVTTGLVYALLLAEEAAKRHAIIPWVDLILHRVVPLAVLADWLIEPPAHPRTARKALAWLAYPLLWLAYTMARGALGGWYPYPFLRPDQPGGKVAVLAYCGAIMFCAMLLTWLIVRVGEWRRAVSGRSGAEPAA